MELPQIQQLALSGTLILLCTLAYARFRTSHPKRPPGPSGLPILGNLLQVPGEVLHLLFVVM